MLGKCVCLAKYETYIGIPYSFKCFWMYLGFHGKGKTSVLQLVGGAVLNRGAAAPC